MLNNNENQDKQNNKKKGTSPLRLNRVFVLDTNVLLHNPNSIYEFQAVVVGIPFIVLEELDQFKKETNEKGRNAREVIRSLDELRSRGSLQEGVELNNKTQGAITYGLKLMYSVLKQKII